MLYVVAYISCCTILYDTYYSLVYYIPRPLRDGGQGQARPSSPLTPKWLARALNMMCI